MEKNNNLLISISGVSSSGKTTLNNELKEIFNIIDNIIIKNNKIIISNQKEFELLNIINNIINNNIKLDNCFNGYAYNFKIFDKKLSDKKINNIYNNNVNIDDNNDNIDNINKIINNELLNKVIKKLKNKVIIYNEFVRILYDNIQFKNMINNKEFVRLQLSILEKEIEKILYIKSNVKNKIIVCDRSLLDVSLYCLLYAQEYKKYLTQSELNILYNISDFCIKTTPNIYNIIFIPERKKYIDDNYRLNEDLAKKEIPIFNNILKVINILNDNNILNEIYNNDNNEFNDDINDVNNNDNINNINNNNNNNINNNISNNNINENIILNDNNINIYNKIDYILFNKNNFNIFLNNLKNNNKNNNLTNNIIIKLTDNIDLNKLTIITSIIMYILNKIKIK